MNKSNITILTTAMFFTFSVIAQTTSVIQQDFGVKAPKHAFGFSQCTTNQYFSGDCYVVSEGVLFVFNDELAPAAIKKVDLEDGFYSATDIEQM
ncbi:hypothetical protein [uncultured Vibrio sp.]|uniref:hypothetical protein n=1 Tax=uncultured Vibrio sp. TaxID=114054 RepID=UPI0025F2C4A4|nr:hypothetical protein [uncultured Vibrio sp.]